MLLGISPELISLFSPYVPSREESLGFMHVFVCSLCLCVCVCTLVYLLFVFVGGGTLLDGIFFGGNRQDTHASPNGPKKQSIASWGLRARTLLVGLQCTFPEESSLQDRLPLVRLGSQVHTLKEQLDHLRRVSEPYRKK